MAKKDTNKKSDKESYLSGVKSELKKVIKNHI